jgi:hypothetical protein
MDPAVSEYDPYADELANYTVRLSRVALRVTIC